MLNIGLVKAEMDIEELKKRINDELDSLFEEYEMETDEVLQAETEGWIDALMWVLDVVEEVKNEPNR